MLENIESLTIIICTVIATSFATITTISSLQKSFRDHIDKVLKDHDTIMRLWINKAFERYYNSLNDSIETFKLRLEKLEKK